MSERRCGNPDGTVGTPFHYDTSEMVELSSSNVLVTERHLALVALDERPALQNEIRRVVIPPLVAEHEEMEHSPDKAYAQLGRSDDGQALVFDESRIGRRMRPAIFDGSFQQETREVVRARSFADVSRVDDPQRAIADEHVPKNEVAMHEIRCGQTERAGVRGQKLESCHELRRHPSCSHARDEIGCAVEHDAVDIVDQSCSVSARIPACNRLAPSSCAKLSAVRRVGTTPSMNSSTM